MNLTTLQSKDWRFILDEPKEKEGSDREEAEDDNEELDDEPVHPGTTIEDVLEWTRMGELRSEMRIVQLASTTTSTRGARNFWMKKVWRKKQVPGM